MPTWTGFMACSHPQRLKFYLENKKNTDTNMFLEYREVMERNENKMW